jgi:hypothetical protein
MIRRLAVVVCLLGLVLGGLNCGKKPQSGPAGQPGATKQQSKGAKKGPANVPRC